MGNKNTDLMNFFINYKVYFVYLYILFQIKVENVFFFTEVFSNSLNVHIIIIENKNQIINWRGSLQHFLLISLPWYLWLIFGTFHFFCVLGWDLCLRAY